jgi:hypothetical protein
MEISVLQQHTAHGPCFHQNLERSIDCRPAQVWQIIPQVFGGEMALLARNDRYQCSTWRSVAVAALL